VSLPEECDDANDVYGDGCLDCKKTDACDACWQTGTGFKVCLGGTDFGEFVQSQEQLGRNNFSEADVYSLLKCFVRNDCVFSDADGSGALLDKCWCGRGDASLCLGSETLTQPEKSAIGPCAQEIEGGANMRLAEADSAYALLAARLGDAEFSLGAALILRQCQTDSTVAGNCVAQCVPAQ
jgi:hypothetical protein